MVDAFGGCCGICGYEKCTQALSFHHLDPNQKDFSFGRLIKLAKAWLTIVKELRKCVCLCHNCHAEVHAGIADIPKGINRFDESYVDYRPKPPMDNCPICGKDKSVYNSTCSRSCANRKSHRVDWDNVDLRSLLREKSYLQISKMLGISDVTVKKRAVKMGLV